MSTRSLAIELTDRDDERCMKCGYTLRGIECEVCPECGHEPWVVVAKVTDPMSREAALAALDAQQVEWETRETSSLRTVGELVAGGGSLVTSLILVQHCDSGCAREVLSNPAPVEGILPIVDVSEPTCPNCQSRVDPNGEPVCPSCGKQFAWVDIDESLASTENVYCRACGYHLAGNVSGACPECGQPIVPTAYQLAEQALNVSTSVEHSAPVRISPRWGSMLFLAWLGVMIGSVAVVIHNASSQNGSGWLAGIVATVFLVASVVLMIVVVHKGKQSS